MDHIITNYFGSFSLSLQSVQYVLLRSCCAFVQFKIIPLLLLIQSHQRWAYLKFI